MPNLFRTVDGTVWKPGQPVALTLADGTPLEGTWTGSATNEKRNWWLSTPGNELTQTSMEVAAIASKDKDTEELLWLDTPPHTRLFFVLEGRAPGKEYRRALMLTVPATPAQDAYLNHERFAFLGCFKPDGSIEEIAPLPPPPPRQPRQGELF
ncbi:MAG TPA: hypothetical protein VK961_05615 [Chthoniobacter sp.]|nr:hypothetical protein [Chthoniobacter sp.]